MSTLHDLIKATPHATERILRYLDELGVRHAGNVSGAALGAVCGVSPQRWRQWVAGTRPMPTGARRLLCRVAGVELPWVSLPWDPDGEGKPLPRGLRHEFGDEVLVRLADGREVPAWWLQLVGGRGGAYYDSEREPLEPIAVLK